VADFLEALRALGGMGLEAADPAGAVAAVLGELKRREIAEVIAWADPLLEQVGLPGAARQAGIAWFVAAQGTDPAEVRAVAARAGAGVTGADWAVTETGTLALFSGPGRPRSAGLLPPLHIALVRRERLLPTMADLFGKLSAVAGGGGFPPALTLITGPSRTGDIEDVLVRKVHGPGDVMVVLLP